MGLIGCSRTQAWRLMRSGIIDKATYRYGRHYIFDADKVLDALKITHR